MKCKVSAKVDIISWWLRFVVYHTWKPREGEEHGGARWPSLYDDEEEEVDDGDDDNEEEEDDDDDDDDDKPGGAR